MAQAFNLVLEDAKLRVTPRDEPANDVLALASGLSVLLSKPIRAPHTLFLCCCPLRRKIFECEVV